MAGRTGAQQGMADDKPADFTILKEEKVYNRFIKVWSRTVRFPDGRESDWDVAGHNVPTPTYAVVFPFHSADCSTTLVKEYAQGPNTLVYTLPAGLYDRSKSKSIRETAIAELSEEAGLRGGTWHALTDENGDGIVELKWCKNRFIPFLVIDPETDPNPGQQDEEEFIRIQPHIPLIKLRDLVLKGEVMLPSVQTTVMATQKLKDLGHDVGPW